MIIEGKLCIYTPAEAFNLYSDHQLDGTLVLVDEGAGSYRVVASRIPHFPVFSRLHGPLMIDPGEGPYRCGHCDWLLETDEKDDPCLNCGFIYPLPIPRSQVQPV